MKRNHVTLRAALALTVLGTVFFTSGCTSDNIKQLDREVEITSAVGIGVTDGEYTEIYESHGGFHGDGVTYSKVQFSDDSALKDIKKSEHWKELPLSDNVAALLYGVTMEEDGAVESIGPYITNDDGNALAPKVENGYYFFMDRQTDEDEDIYDDSSVLGRSSYNFTVAVYDTDTDTMHYFKLDT